MLLLKFNYSEFVESEIDCFVRLKFKLSSKCGFVFILWLESTLLLIKALSFLMLLFISSSDIVKVKLSNEGFRIESGFRERVLCKNYNLSIADCVIVLVCDFFVC